MRSQCISRPFITCTLPTTGMLFSATQATTQALQPVQEFRSMAMPQAWPSYFHGAYIDSSGFGTCAMCCANVGSCSYCARVPTRISARFSIWKWPCVQATL